MVVVREDSLPPEMLDPVEWPEESRKAYATRLIATVKRRLTNDVESAIMMLDRANELSVWQWAECDSFDDYISLFGLSQPLIHDMRDAISSLRQRGYTGKITQAKAQAEQARQIQADPDAVLRDERGGQPGNRNAVKSGNEVGITNIVTNQNNTYLTKRLKRDRPDLLQSVVDGELSVNQAAIQAGFRKQTQTLPVDPVALGNALRRKYNAADWESICEAYRGASHVV